MADGATLPADHLIGANGPPAEEPDTYGAHAAHIDDLYVEAGAWADGADIENAEQFAEVERLIGMFKDAIDACIVSRDEAKKPHADKVNAIQAQYYPLIGETKAITGKAIRAKAALLAVKTKWANKVAKDQADEAAWLRKEAEAKIDEARLAHAASVGNLEAAEEAEELFKEADQAARAAVQAAKPTVKGMRDNWVVKGFAEAVEHDGATISGKAAAIRHYMRTRPADLLEACLSLAREEVRSGIRKIPGLIIENERKAI